MRRPAAVLFAALLFGATAALPEEGAPFGSPAPRIFEALEAQRTDCPASRTDRFDDHIVVRCAATSAPLKAIKKRWRKAVRSGAPADFVQWDGSPWKKMGQTEHAVYAFLHGLPVAITFDEADGTLTANWPQSYPGCHPGHDVTWLAQTEDVLSPVSKEWVRPAFPEKAHIQRAGGVVMGSFLVDTSGRVVDVCLAGVYPPGLGFEQASVEAQSRTRYEPASRGGEPVAVAAAFSHTYWIGVEGSYVSSLLRNYFDGVRRDK